MKIILLAAIAIGVIADETPALREFKSGNIKFSANTYKELVKQNTDKNFLVCPLSVAVVLALAEAGSGGRTAEQLITGLNLPDTKEKIHNAFKAIAPSLNVDDRYTISSANKIYIKKGYNIKKEFKEVATEVFKAEINNIDFDDSALAAEQINKWVSQKTHDKIKDLISKGDIDAQTRAILVNALYFHGLWDEPFFVDSTTEKNFHISNTKETKVKMMEQTTHLQFFHDSTNLKAKFLEMNYFQSPLSMIFVLPDDVEGLATLEAKIEEVLEIPKLKTEKVHVQIPHVNVESSIEFVPILKKFGVLDAFDKSANFSGIIQEEENLLISKIIQKTFIAVEEKGTTAAAATAAIFKGYSAPFRDPNPTIQEFEANHPFIFILKSPNGILFVGRYVNPNN